MEIEFKSYALFMVNGWLNKNGSVMGHFWAKNQAAWGDKLLRVKLKH